MLPPILDDSHELLLRRIYGRTMQCDGDNGEKDYADCHDDDDDDDDDMYSQRMSVHILLLRINLNSHIYTCPS